MNYVNDGNRHIKEICIEQASTGKYGLEWHGYYSHIADWKPDPDDMWSNYIPVYENIEMSRTIIDPIYDSIELVADNFYLLCLNGKYGMQKVEIDRRWGDCIRETFIAHPKYDKLAVVAGTSPIVVTRRGHKYQAYQGVSGSWCRNTSGDSTNFAERACAARSWKRLLRKLARAESDVGREVSGLGLGLHDLAPYWPSDAALREAHARLGE